MDLKEVYTQENFSGFLSKIGESSFAELLDLFNDNIIEDFQKTAESLLKAIDEGAKVAAVKDNGTVPSNVVELFKDHALAGRLSLGCFVLTKKWFKALDLNGSGEEKEDKPKKTPVKKPVPKKTEEVSKKIEEIKEEQEEAQLDKPVAVVYEEEEEQEQEEPVEEIKKEEEEPKPKLEPGEVVDKAEEEEAKAKDKVRTDALEAERKEAELKKKRSEAAKKAAETRKKKEEQAKKKEDKRNEDILSINPNNVDIYDTTPETHPDLFLEFEGEFISKRVLSKSWKTHHPSNNPVSNDLLGEIVTEFMKKPLKYSDVMRMVDEMRCPYTSYTAKRIWWMVKYNEFLRYSLVKEKTGYGEESYRLVQRWLNTPIIEYVYGEWSKANNKKR